MFRTPDITEISVSIHVEATTKPTIDYAMVTGITATQVTVSVKMASAASSPTTEWVAVQINA